MRRISSLGPTPPETTQTNRRPGVAPLRNFRAGRPVYTASEIPFTKRRLKPNSSLPPMHTTPSSKIAVLLPLEGDLTPSILRGLHLGGVETNQKFVAFACPTYGRHRSSGMSYSLSDLGYRSSDFDATILYFGDPTLLEQCVSLHRAGHPCFFVARAHPDIPHLMPDDKTAIRELVARFHGTGHRRIGFLRGPAQNASANRRHAGYLEGLAACGLDVNETLVLDGDFTAQTAFNNLDRALRRGLRLDAVIASNDAGAYGLVDAFRTLGINVPGEVEVVGFDDLPGSALFEPPLTTFRLPAMEMAHHAILQTAKLIHGEPVQRESLIPVEFIARQTTRLSLVNPSAAAPLLRPSGKDPESSGAIAALVASQRWEGLPAETLASIGKVVAGALRAQLPLSLVSDAILARADNVAPSVVCSRQDILRAGLEVATRTGALAEIESLRRARQVETLAVRLSEQAFDGHTEDAIADALRETMGYMGFADARLYLKSHEADSAGKLFSWDLKGALHAKRPAADHDVRADALALLAHHRAVCVSPLIDREEVVGNLIADGNSHLSHYLEELTRHVTSALHSLRLNKALAQKNETLRQSESFYSSLVESLPQLIARKDAHGRITYANSCFADFVGLAVKDLIGRGDEDLFPPDFAARSRADEQRILSGGAEAEFEHVFEREGERRFFHVKKTALRATAGSAPIGVQVLLWDVTAFRETEQNLRETQRELIDVSRRAGIAEVASGVLHNVGNALNSVNISVGMLNRAAASLKAESIGKLGQLLTAEGENWSGCFDRDDRGRNVVRFAASLEAHVQGCRKQILDELESLRTGVEHIHQIVIAQQEFAQLSGVVEEMVPTEPLEYALRLCESELLRHGVAVVRDYQPAPRVRIERHKAVQVLVNLLRNAKESLARANSSCKRITIGLRESSAGGVEYRIQDNGEGIAPEHLEKLFTLGFTTKRGGHGFGLHNSALAAKSVGGSLQATSDGLGAGACFLFTLPPGASIPPGT